MNEIWSRKSLGYILHIKREFNWLHWVTNVKHLHIWLAWKTHITCSTFITNMIVDPDQEKKSLHASSYGPNSWEWAQHKALCFVRTDDWIAVIFAWVTFTILLAAQLIQDKNCEIKLYINKTKKKKRNQNTCHSQSVVSFTFFHFCCCCFSNGVALLLELCALAVITIVFMHMKEKLNKENESQAHGWRRWKWNETK